MTAPSEDSGGIANESRDRGITAMTEGGGERARFERAMPPTGDSGAGPAALARPLADFELPGRDSKIDLNAAVDDAHRVRVHREDGGERLHFTG